MTLCWSWALTFKKWSLKRSEANFQLWRPIDWVSCACEQCLVAHRIDLFAVGQVLSCICSIPGKAPGAGASDRLISKMWRTWPDEIPICCQLDSLIDNTVSLWTCDHLLQIDLRLTICAQQSIRNNCVPICQKILSCSAHCSLLPKNKEGEFLVNHHS